MNQQEVKQLLTVAASMDPTMMPADDAALLTKIAVWANALRKIDYQDGVAAVYDHYKRDATKSVSVGVIYQACQGARTPAGEHFFTECNPLIVAPHGDVDGRYEVWCRRCGHENAAYADTIGEARLLADHHQYEPPTFRHHDLVEPARDWSESVRGVD
jgi:hypothetical protein